MKWLPVISNICYPVAGLFGNWITFFFGLVLGGGSAWMHYEEEYINRSRLAIWADWFGMYAFTLSALSLHIGYWVLIALIPMVIWIHVLRNNTIIGVFVLCVIILTGSWWSLAFFLPAVFIRQRWEHTKYQDYSHSIWHLLTSIGYYIIIGGA